MLAAWLVSSGTVTRCWRSSVSRSSTVSACFHSSELRSARPVQFATIQVTFEVYKTMATVDAYSDEVSFRRIRRNNEMYEYIQWLKEGNIFTNMLRVLDKTFWNFIATRIQSKLIMYRDDSSRIRNQSGNVYASYETFMYCKRTHCENLVLSTPYKCYII